MEWHEVKQIELLMLVWSKKVGFNGRHGCGRCGQFRWQRIQCERRGAGTTCTGGSGCILCPSCNGVAKGESTGLLFFPAETINRDLGRLNKSFNTANLMKSRMALALPHCHSWGQKHNVKGMMEDLVSRYLLDRPKERLICSGVVNWSKIVDSIDMYW